MDRPSIALLVLAATVYSIVSLVMLSGCQSSAVAIPGVPLQIETRHGYMGTRQLCRSTPELAGQVQRAYAALIAALASRGHSTVWSSGNDGQPIICRILQPEPCTWGTCGVGDTSPRCARKRGCACAWGLWISENWPPVCRDWWRDEPHCVGSRSMQSSAGFYRDLAHEVQEMLHARGVGPDPHSPAGLQILTLAVWSSDG